MTQITSIITRNGWTLTDQRGKPISIGQPVTSGRGDVTTLRSGTPPHRPGVSGYVETEDGAEFYPTVFGLRWVSPDGRYFGDSK